MKVENDGIKFYIFQLYIFNFSSATCPNRYLNLEDVLLRKRRGENLEIPDSSAENVVLADFVLKNANFTPARVQNLTSLIRSILVNPARWEVPWLRWTKLFSIK